jgi:hypothetical protein
VDVIHHPALRCPDFPPAVAGDHPTLSGKKVIIVEMQIKNLWLASKRPAFP